MRSCLHVLVCLVAFSGGVLIAVGGAGHSLQLFQIWNTGSALYSTTASALPSLTGNSPEGWTPPKEIPAHANWTWHMSNNKRYEDVVITQINSREVTITHSLGVAHLPLDSLPPDVQQELGYTPNAASSDGAATNGPSH